jgi:hypothetical protein
MLAEELESGRQMIELRAHGWLRLCAHCEQTA